MYDAYRNKLYIGNENIMQAQLNYSLHLIAHTLSQQNAKSPKPFKSSVEDYMFKIKTSAREEAERWINGD